MATQHALNPLEEFRFEAGPDAVALTLMSGKAEVFGSEMVALREYTFKNTQQAVFSWHGCTLEINGNCVHSYVAKETPMHSYLELHMELERRRAAAKANGTSGPSVLIAGPSDTGKSSLCRLLVNYLTRCGNSATLVDLDFAQGEMCVPGCIAAVPVHRPLDIERGTGGLSPLVYWFGHISAAERAAHLRRVVGLLASAATKRLELHPDSKYSGLIVNTCGWVDGEGLELLQQQIVDFRADVLVTIGDDRLHSQLEQFAKTQPRQPLVLKVSKSGGVITRSATSRAVAHSSRLKEYFYGIHNELSPTSCVLDVSAIQIFSIGAAPQAPMSALPIGVRLQRDQLAATLLATAHFPSLVHSVLAVAMTDSNKCDDLLQANVAGFVFVTAVDMERQKITFLSPSAAVLPSTRFLAGAIKWQD